MENNIKGKPTRQELHDFLTSLKIKATIQRLVIFEEVINQGNAVGVDALSIHKKISIDNPSLSIGTVYRTLYEFADKGAVTITQPRQKETFAPVSIEKILAASAPAKPMPAPVAPPTAPNETKNTPTPTPASVVPAKPGAPQTGAKPTPTRPAPVTV